MDRKMRALATSFLALLFSMFVSLGAAAQIDGTPPDWAVSTGADGNPLTTTVQSRINWVVVVIASVNLQIAPGHTILVSWQGGTQKWASRYRVGLGNQLTESTPPYAIGNIQTAFAERVNYCSGSYTKVTVSGFWRQWTVTVGGGGSSGWNYHVTGVTTQSVPLCGYNYLVDGPDEPEEM